MCFNLLSHASICVASDNTDVFILLIHFYGQESLSCETRIGINREKRTLIDVEATVKAHTCALQYLLAVQCISGCVFNFFGVGKGASLKAFT